MISLRAFTADDIPLLLDWIPTYPAMMLWAGPTFTWPLDEPQLIAAAEESATPLRRTWLVLDDDIPVGHASIRIDDGASGRMSRVVVAPDARGRGLGGALVAAVLAQAFGSLGLNRVELGVFQHNASAVHLYERFGFRTYDTLQDVEEVEGASWTALGMELFADDWRTRQITRT